jgi:hypothetical protein
VIIAPLQVSIKIRSINFNTSYTSSTISGIEAETVGLLLMTFDWDWIVGNTITPTPGILAIKAASNGNVGIGTPNPT